MPRFENGLSRSRKTLWLAVVLLVLNTPDISSAAPPQLLPAPAIAHYGVRLVPAPGRFVLHGHDDPRLQAGLIRLLRRIESRTGLVYSHLPTGEYAIAGGGSGSACEIECLSSSQVPPVLGEDETYRLDVSPAKIGLQAPTVLGALHGFETLLQLFQSYAGGGWILPEVHIEDRPRFPWRGLMIDVARHWQPMEVIKRNLDGMALVKLNVLHLHLTDDQGFRIESKTFPRLHELGSDGHYFTQDQMRELIGYAADRGIRIVPEFDIPGHATSWLVAYPELGSAPGPYAIERKWGVFDPVLDPTNSKVYEILDGFLGEMAALFPDAYIHIGGDENNGVHWNANPNIQAYIREHNLKDNAGLHAYFNGRIHAILTRNGKTLIGWDEILHPDLPAGSVVHSWRGPEGIAAAVQRGYASILSNGYYIDLCHPAWEHYLNDPIPAGSVLLAAQQKLVLGGEATMWSEWVTPETIDSRIWPRTAAIAERLWSPREVRDVPDMYRRLDIVSQRLAEAGLTHESYFEPALRQLAGGGASPDDLAAWRTFLELVEPVKDYRRGGQQPDCTQQTPLTGLVDCARPDSAAARIFARQVDEAISSNVASPEIIATISQQLATWKMAAGRFTGGLALQTPQSERARLLFEALRTVCETGEASVALLVSGSEPVPGWLPRQIAALDRAGQPQLAVELPIIAPLKLLAAAAANPQQRVKLSAAEWLHYLRTAANPPADAGVGPN